MCRCFMTYNVGGLNLTYHSNIEVSDNSNTTTTTITTTTTTTTITTRFTLFRTTNTRFITYWATRNCVALSQKWYRNCNICDLLIL